jgi:predicted ATPase/class 3 adenylate cyclase
MDFTLLVTLVKWLLQQEQRLSFRYIRRQFALDDATFEDLRHELIIGRGLAREADAEAFVWIGAVDRPDTFSASQQADSLDSDAQSSRFAESALDPSNRPTVIEPTPLKTAQEAERRQLTVMFCDLVGSTELSTRLDPEDLRDVITAFQEECRAAVERYDGFIARYMGDGVLVYFGYPQAHENDAERAARAGLDIVSSMSALNSDIGQAHDVVLAVRVGIATGPVIVGDLIGEGAAEEAAVVGETPNLAARLQGVALPNQVVVAGMTRRMLGEMFELEDLHTHELKGIAEPVQAWRVAGERDVESRFAATRTAASTALMGRDEEVGLLQRAWDSAREGRGQVVLIQGEAGLGKSRLVETLSEAAGAKGTDYIRVAMRSSPYHKASALHPVIEHLKRFMRWEVEDSESVRLNKLESALRGYKSLPAESVALIAGLMSLPLPEGYGPPLNMSAELQREMTLDALTGWQLEDAERMPVLMVWEDLHWADATTVELLGILSEQAPTVPMLVVGTYRPEFVPPWPQRSHTTPITLNRLEAAEVESMVTELAGGMSMPAEVLAHIVLKADGVPLYVEELTRTVIDSELLKVSNNAYVLTGSVHDLHIPETLQDSLMARLDRFPVMREVAQKAAVLGREFTYEMLDALMGMEVVQLQKALGQLVEDGLLYQRGRPPRSKYIFKHALIQDAAYQSLLNRTRQQFHRKIAEHIEQQLPSLAATEPELIARHYAAAELAEKALDYWELAGQQARNVSANSEAVGHFRNVLDVLATLEPTQERTRRTARAYLSTGAALTSTQGGAAEEVEEAFSAASTLSVQLGDKALLSRAIHGSLGVHAWRGQWPQVNTSAQRLLELGHETQQPADLLVAYSSLAESNWWQGKFCAANEQSAEAIQLGLTLPAIDPGVSTFARVSSHSCAAFTTWCMGYPDRARQRIDEALELSVELKHPLSHAHALHYAGLLSLFLRHPQEALVFAESELDLGEKLQSELWIAGSHVYRGIARMMLGAQDEGRAEAQEALATWRSIGANVAVPQYLAQIAQCLLHQGDVEGALAALGEAREVGERTGEICYMAEIDRLLGEAKLASGEQDSRSNASAHFHRALGIAREQQGRMFELRASMSLARLWRTMGRTEDARTLVQAIYGWFTEGFDTPDLTEARALIEELASGNDHLETHSGSAI